MTRKKAVLVKEKPCSAPGCARQARSGSALGPVCALHYRRVRSFGSFGLRPGSKLSFQCSSCGADFNRTYTQSFERQSKSQYCSPACEAAGKRQAALSRIGERFWRQVAIRGADECWPWMGPKSPRGYGRFEAPGSTDTIASRWAYFLTKGERAGPLFACHSCDNPPCCNPRHIFLGTALDNYQDMASKGRRRWNPVSCSRHPMARLSEDAARAIRGSAEPSRRLAEEYGVGLSTIQRIRSGKSWARLNEARP